MCDENESTIKKAFDLPVAFCVANQHYLKEMLQVSFDFLKYFNENIISNSICVQKVYNLCHLLSIEMLNVRELIIIDTFYP